MRRASSPPQPRPSDLVVNLAEEDEEEEEEETMLSRSLDDGRERVVSVAAAAAAAASAPDEDASSLAAMSEDGGMPLFDDGLMSMTEGNSISAGARGRRGDGGRGRSAVGLEARSLSRESTGEVGGFLGRIANGAGPGADGVGSAAAAAAAAADAESARSSSGSSEGNMGVRSRRRGVSLGGVGMRSGLSRKFVRSLIRHLCLRADSRQREDLRSMVETLKGVANQPGVDMKQELKREAVSLLGPELAREAFEASLSETRNEFLRQRIIADASAAAAAATTAIGGGAAAAAAAADAAGQELEDSSMMVDSAGRVRDAPAGGSTGGAVGVLQGRRTAHPHPRKRKSFGCRRESLDSNGEESASLAGRVLPFFALPEEEVEQRLKALHKGPAHEDFHLCCVCMDRPRDAAMIHGKTSHQACCYDCATELFERELPCPCCRQSIACVVKNYL